MIGTKVTVRLRMGAHDAHYAGELVDGARMLALFGDVATELLIRLDGDEGLFRAYETVEFLAPVFAGDYIEATGELVKIGNTSRQIRFEARKVIANVRERGIAPSAADVLPEPVVVCRAIGHVRDAEGAPAPAEGPLHARAAHGRARPAAAPSSRRPPRAAGRARCPRSRSTRPRSILTAAIVGAEITREQTPHLPDHAAGDRRRGRAVPRGRRRRHPPARPQRRRHAPRSRGIASPRRSSASARRPTASSRSRPAAPSACRSRSASGRSRASRRWRRSTAARSTSATTCSSTRARRSATSPRASRASGAVAELECYEVGHVEEALALAREGHHPAAAPLPVRPRRPRRHQRERARTSASWRRSFPTDAIVGASPRSAASSSR